MVYTPTEHETYAPAQGAPPEDAGIEPSTTMRVRKRSGAYETADVMKIVRAVERSSGGLHEVDPLRIATRTISGLYDGGHHPRARRALHPHRGLADR